MTWKKGERLLRQEFGLEAVEEEKEKPKEVQTGKTDSSRVANDCMTYRELVRLLLESVLVTRDNDLYLYYHLLRHMGRDPISLKVHDLFARMQDASLPHFTAIVMLRRNWQDKCPELRGHLYDSRLLYERDAQIQANVTACDPPPVGG